MPQTSLKDHVQMQEAGAEIIAAAFLKDEAVYALADGSLFFANGQRLNAHPDAAILTAAANNERFITGGDDGRIVETNAAGEMRLLGDEKAQWIDAIALRPDGAAAWSAGKRVIVRDQKGGAHQWIAPSSVRGLCFFPKGFRLAIAHYNGASLWFPDSAAPPQFLEWKGSHLDVTISRDGRFIITSMQENMLHGWRIADLHNMRMTGYPAKTRSFSWSSDGRWLATSGAEACIFWPFQSKDGPIGRGPRECGVREFRVSCVAFHPNALIVAIGYEDGWILLCRLTDGAEILVRNPDEKDSISAFQWDAQGKKLAFGTKSGVAGCLTLPA